MLEPALESFYEVFYRPLGITDIHWEFIHQNLSLVSLKKGEFLLRPGDSADRFYFVHTGLLKRYFITLEGQEYITSFDSEKQSCADYASLIEGVPSQLHIQAIEDAEVLASTPGLFLELQKLHPVFQVSGRVIAENRYVEKCRREQEFLSLTAKQRYINFQTSHQHLLARLAKTDIARYLGISNVSLSRILASLDG